MDKCLNFALRDSKFLTTLRKISYIFIKLIILLTYIRYTQRDRIDWTHTTLHNYNYSTH